MQAPLTVENVCKILNTTYAGLGRLLGVEDAAVHQWKGTGFPPGRALQLEKISEGRLKASDLKVRFKKPIKRRKREAA
jgi:DNA-binding transcriptional regulator YdaS (Cro superfamily)